MSVHTLSQKSSRDASLLSLLPHHTSFNERVGIGPKLAETKLHVGNPTPIAGVVRVHEIASIWIRKRSQSSGPLKIEAHRRWSWKWVGHKRYYEKGDLIMKIKRTRGWLEAGELSRAESHEEQYRTPRQGQLKPPVIIIFVSVYKKHALKHSQNVPTKNTWTPLSSRARILTSKATMGNANVTPLWAFLSEDHRLSRKIRRIVRQDSKCKKTVCFRQSAFGGWGGQET